MLSGLITYIHHQGGMRLARHGPLSTFIWKSKILTAAMNRLSAQVSIPACHAGDPGLIPDNGAINTLLDFPCSYFLVHFFFIQICSRRNPVCQKAHRIVKYLKLKWMNLSIELRELV